MTTITRVTVDSSIAPKLREWFDTGRGVTVWTNLEIASGAAREVFTPSTSPCTYNHEQGFSNCPYASLADRQAPHNHDTQAPNWRYGNPTKLEREDIDVSVFVVRETFRGRFKAMYFGPWVGKATEAKATRLCSAGETWRWEYDGSGYVKVSRSEE